jgi:hypothetical protein
VTDLRDQPATVDLRNAILLTGTRTRIGDILWRLRHTAGYSLEGLALRLSISRSGVHRREALGFLPASALAAHLDALGYDLVAVRRARALTPDRRTAA